MWRLHYPMQIMSWSLLDLKAQVFSIDQLRNQSWCIVGVGLKIIIPLHFEGDLVHVAPSFLPGNLGELIQCLNTPLCGTRSRVSKVLMRGRIRTSTIFFSYVFKWIIEIILLGFAARRSGSQLYIRELLISFHCANWLNKIWNSYKKGIMIMNFMLTHAFRFRQISLFP